VGREGTLVQKKRLGRRLTEEKLKDSKEESGGGIREKKSGGWGG